jgi:hypothetical protein
VITGIVATSVLTAIGSLVGLRWRINLQRHKFDRAAELIDTAYLWGGTEGVGDMTNAIDVLLTRTTPELRYSRAWPLVGRRRPQGGAPRRSDDSPCSDAG